MNWLKKLFGKKTINKEESVAGDNASNLNVQSVNDIEHGKGDDCGSCENCDCGSE